MSPTRLEHHEVEAVLTGSPVDRDDLADLAAFLAVISTESSPPMDVEQMGSALAATARSSRRSAGRGLRRLATLAAAGATLIAMSGVALAADGSSPGDSLYSIDRAMERVGLGAGGVQERVLEFDVLIARDSDDEAYVFLAEVIESAPGPDARLATRHLEVAIAELSPSAAQAEEKVAEIHGFLAGNLGPGVGLDGREFGQAIAEIARSEAEPASGSEPTGPEDRGSADGAATTPGNPGGGSQGAPGQGDSPGDPTPGSQSERPDSPPGRSESPPSQSNGNRGQPGESPPADSGSQQDTSDDDPGSGDTSGPGGSPGSNQGNGQGDGSSNANNDQTGGSGQGNNGNGNDKP